MTGLLFVYPIGSFPAVAPVEGDPGVLLGNARRLVGIAAQLQSAADRLQAQVASTTNSCIWQGMGASAFYASTTVLIASYRNAAGAGGVAAQALATYAAELQRAQHVAQAAMAARDAAEDARRAHNARLAAVEASPDAGITQAGDLLAEQERVTGANGAAQRLAQDAHDLVRQAAAKAAGTLHEAAAMTGVRQQAAAEAAQREAEEAAANDKPWWSDVGHGILDVGGLVPLVGEPADGINALWYGAEGDTTNAALSAAGMVPLLGWGATGGKAVGKGMKYADDAADVAKATQDATSVTKRAKPAWLEEGTAWHGDVQKALTDGSGVPVKFVDDASGATLGGPTWTKELYVHGDSVSGYRRVDGYTPSDGGSVLSLKSGQYGGADAGSTYRAKAAIDELVDKYGVGRTIADVPSTPGHLSGTSLSGQPILGIPVQVEPLPQSVLDHAADMGVRIAEIDIPVTRGGK